MEKIRQKVDKVIEFILIILMAASVLNVIWQVITRFIMHNPSSYTEEIARFLLIWVGLLGAAWGIGKNIHLAIDIVRQKAKDNVKSWIDVIINAMVLIFAVTVMIIGGIHLVNLTLELNQISAALQIKLGYIYMVVPISGCLMSFYSIVNLINLIKERGSVS